VSTAIFSMGARGLLIEGNLVTGMGDNGILVWQPDRQSDGTIITGNRIEKIEPAPAAKARTATASTCTGPAT
jgi:hypothetical protein